MKSLKDLVLIPLLTFLAGLVVIEAGMFFATSLAWASPYGFESQEFSAYLESSYYMTSQDFTSTGVPIALPSGNQFSEMRFDLSAAYDFNDWLEMYTTLGFKRTSSVYSDPFLGTITKNNMNISDVTLGSNFLLYSGIFNIIPDISVLIPFYPTPVGIDNNVLLGDGAIVGTAKVYITKKIHSVLLSGFGGVALRTQGLSTLIPYGVLGHADIKSFFVELGAGGAFSINNDQYQYNPLYRIAVTSTLDAGSLVYDAINPSWFDGMATAGWRFTKDFFATVGIEQGVWGTNTALGTRFLVGLGFNGNALGTDTGTPSYGGSSGKFEVDTDSEDKIVPNGENNSHGQGKVIGPIH